MVNKLPDYYCYPAIFRQKENQVVILFPNFDGILSAANTMEEAPSIAKEALSLHLYGLEEEQYDIPKAFKIGEIYPQENEIIFLVEVYMPSIREKFNSAFEKKTLSIPHYLNKLGEKNKVNFSKLLQDALTKLDLH